MPDNNHLTGESGTKESQEAHKSQPLPVEDSGERSTPDERPSRPKMRRNRFGLSEASVAEAESSHISAEGRIQPSRRKSISSPKQADQTTGDEHVEHDGADKANVDARETTSPFEEPLYEVDTRESLEIKAPHGSDAPLVVPSKDSSYQEASTYKDTLSGTLIPDIQVHAPTESGSEAHSPAYGTTHLATTSTAAIPSAPNSSPDVSHSPLQIAALDQALLDASTNITDSSRVVDTMQSAHSGLHQLNIPLTVPVDIPTDAIPTQPVRGQRIKGRMRKIMLRRRVLVLLLGRQLSEVTHAQLKQAQDITGTVPATAGP